MRRILRMGCASLILLAIAAGGAVWWLLSYIAPERELAMSYERIDVRAKALDMVKRLKPELVLTESDINHLIKMNLKRDIADNVLLDGADFKLQGSRLLAELNVTYMGRIPAEVRAEYNMEWRGTELVLTPQSLAVKRFELPIDWLETVVVPLDLPATDMVELDDIRFEAKQIRIMFKVHLPF